MADRATLGPVQVINNDIWALNDAFRQVTERIDAIKGLRGRTLIYDRIRSDDPVEDQDVLTRGSLSVVAQVVFMASTTGVMFRQPGASFVEPMTELRCRYNFTGGQASTARLIMFGWGTETGSKSLRVTNGTDILCTLTWTGTGETLRASEAEVLDLTDAALDDELRLTCALSSATESLIFNRVILELGG